jgi:hypothetical protein
VASGLFGVPFGLLCPAFGLSGQASGLFGLPFDSSGLWTLWQRPIRLATTAGPAGLNYPQSSRRGLRGCIN